MTQLTRKEKVKNKYFRQRLILYVLVVAILAVVVFFLASFVLFAWYSKDLPEPGKVKRLAGFSTVFLDREGEVIYEMYKDKNRLPIKIEDVPDHLVWATVAIEDKDFFKHQGISIRGIVRAIVNTVLKRRLEGGSTLTQQLIKNVLLTPERTLTRKIKEFILASEVERRYSKEEILEMYINEAPYGGIFWGVESAARGYFGQSVKELNLVQSAILAGLPQRPSFYSPFIGKPDAYIARTQDVLRRMREDGYIDENQERQALDELERFKFEKARLPMTAPHFVFYVRDQLLEKFGEKILDQGVTIKTTLSKEVQQEAEKIVKEEIKKLKGYNATNGALVVLDSPTNEILAMVGSYDYDNEEFGKFNAALGLRQPGSAIKPITYSLAFDKGYTPSTVVMDLETVFPNQGEKDYVPVNYDGKHRGPVQLRFALGNSINIVAVKLLAMVGVRDFLQQAYAMGLATFEPTSENLRRFGLSITLGGGETRLLDLTSAFSILARGGTKKDYSSIVEVRDYKDKIIYQAKPAKEKRVVSQASSFLVSHILSDNNARVDIFGPRSYLHIAGKTVAVKTGTTDDKRDNWTIGYTRGVAVGVWVGNNDNSPMNPQIASGLTGASPIWNRMMRFLLTKYPDGIIEPPDNVVALEIDAFLGGLPHPDYPRRSEYFIKGTEPKDISPFFKKLKISKNNGKLANELEIKLNQHEEKEYIIIEEEDPVSQDEMNRWQQAIDQWAASQPEEKFHPPKETSDFRAEDVVVQIKTPRDRETLSNNFNLKAKLTSLDSIAEVSIYVNDAVVKNFKEDKKEIDEVLFLSDGVYEIKVGAKNVKGKTGEAKITIGVNKPWDWKAEPTITPYPTATSTPTPAG